MAKARAGFERTLLYTATAGTKAVTPFLLAKDIDVDITFTRGDTTVRGDGTAIPKQTQINTQQIASITFVMEYDDGDAGVAAFMAAARTGAAIAVLTKIYVGDAYADEFDGDVTVDVSHPGPLAGVQEVTVTCVPTKEGGRPWDYMNPGP